MHFLCLVLPISLLAQEPLAINYNLENGLLSNEIYDLFEDQDGFIWVGTDKGAIRFDGTQMKSFTLSEGLADNDVLSIHQASDGAIWFLSYNGKLSYYKAGKVYNENHDSRLKKIRSKSYFSSFLEDSYGNLWFGTHLNGIFRLSTSGEVTHYTETSPIYNNAYSTQLDIDFAVTQLFEDASNVVCFTNALATYYFDGSQFKLSSSFMKTRKRPRSIFHEGVLYIADERKVFASDMSNGNQFWECSLGKGKMVNRIALLPDSNLSVSTNQGFFILNKQGSIIEHLYPELDISDVLIDREGSLWLSTLNNGIYLIRDKSALKHTKKPSYSIFKTDTSILFGGKELEVYKFDGKNLDLLHIEKEEINPESEDGRVLAIKGDEQQLWMATDWGLFNLKDGKLKPLLYKFVEDIELCNHRLLALTRDNYLLQLDSIILDSLASIYERDHNTRKSASNFQIINRYSTYPSQFCCISTYLENSFLVGADHGLFVNADSALLLFESSDIGEVIDIKVENSGNVWILDKENRLVYINKDQKSHSLRLNAKEQIDKRCFLYLEKDSIVWIANNTSLINLKYIDSGSYTSKSYSEVTNERINDLIVLNDTLWLATAGGVISLPKKTLIDTIPPLLHVDSITEGLNKFTLDELDQLKSHTTYTVHYTGISFKDKGKLLYKYQLDGGDLSIIDSTEERFIHLQYLPSSDYTLRIYAKDASGNESSYHELKFTINTRLWMTSYFWSLITFFTLAILVFIIRSKKKLNKKVELEALNMKAKAQETRKFITVKSVMDGSLVKIWIEELYYIKASKDYIELMLEDKKILVRSTMKKMEKQLQEGDGFFRVHRSYLVHLKKIKAFQSDSIQILDQKIPISKRNRSAIKAYFSKQKSN